MVNSNLDTSPWGVNRTAFPTQKQSPLAKKKAALRDVQNDYRNIRCYPPESSCQLGGPVTNGIKVFGTKLIPSDECTVSTAEHLSLRSNGAKEELMPAGVSLDLELGKKRDRDISEETTDFLNSKRYLSKQLCYPHEEKTKRLKHETCCLPAFTPTSPASTITLSPGKNDQHRMDRFLRLQDQLKKIDESDQRDYTQMLRCLSPSELSKHAVELEKRSMQLSVVEVREIRRMKELGILDKSPSRLSGFQQSPFSM